MEIAVRAVLASEFWIVGQRPVCAFLSTFALFFREVTRASRQNVLARIKTKKRKKKFSSRILPRHVENKVNFLHGCNRLVVS